MSCAGGVRSNGRPSPGGGDVFPTYSAIQPTLGWMALFVLARRRRISMRRPLHAIALKPARAVREPIQRSVTRKT
jgi:hypothetical protein